MRRRPSPSELCVRGSCNAARVRRAALIVNPVASRVTPERVDAVAAALVEAGPVTTIQTEHPGHATELAAEVCRSVDEVYVFSGDGGYNEVVNGMLPDVPVGFLPGGATSVLPRALGLPRDPAIVYEVQCDAPGWSASAGTFRADSHGRAYVVLNTAARRGEYDAMRIVRRNRSGETDVLQARL